MAAVPESDVPALINPLRPGVDMYNDSEDTT